MLDLYLGCLPMSKPQYGDCYYQYTIGNCMLVLNQPDSLLRLEIPNTTHFAYVLEG